LLSSIIATVSTRSGSSSTTKIYFLSIVKPPGDCFLLSQVGKELTAFLTNNQEF
jgi:hypothetical protein